LLIVVAVIVVAVGASIAEEIMTATKGEQVTEPAVTPKPLSKAEICKIEIFAEAAYLYDNGFSNYALNNLGSAIGMTNSNKHYQIAAGVAAFMQHQVLREGINDAMPEITQDIERECRRNGNPTLTSGQLHALKQLVDNPTLDAIG
jgi:hypothetical protein